MKKVIGILVTIAILALIVFGYLRIGQKAGTTATEVMKESQGQVDNAKQAVEELNKSTQATDKALEQVTGKKGE
jgi:Sec-independent protein translocase protein TatA